MPNELEPLQPGRRYLVMTLIRPDRPPSYVELEFGRAELFLAADDFWRRYLYPALAQLKQLELETEVPVSAEVS